jgi:membrane protease YdiL (CAAX protease family)
MSHAPRWPGWTIPAFVVALVLGGLFTSIAIGLAAAAVGVDDLTPALVLVGAVAYGAVAWLVLRLIARQAGVDLEPSGLGLRRVAPRMALVMLGFGLLVGLVAGGLTALLGEFDPSHPQELGGETAVIGLDVGTAATILARAVLVAVLLEVILRGYLLAALLGHVGRWPAIVVVGFVSALSAPLDIAPAAVAVGIALGVMYVESGSILPGAALSGAVHGFVLGLSFDWGPFESAALGAVTGLLAFLCVLGPTRSWDPGPARS